MGGTPEELEAETEVSTSPLRSGPKRSSSSPRAPGVLKVRPAAQSEIDTERVTVHRAALVGLVTWCAFFGLDLYMCFVVVPEAPVLPFVAYRVVGLAAAAIVYIGTRRPGWRVRGLRISFASFVIAFGALISQMGLELGGIVSPYMHGISVVVLGAATLNPQPLERMIRVVLPTALTFPAVMIIASFFDPRVAGQLDTPGVLATAFANYVFVIGGATVACVAAQTVWGARKQLSEARRLGQYRLTAPIGRGGMSEVWLAWDSRLKRNVALKILRGNTEADAIRRFEQEAYATSKLTSPNTIRIFDFGASDDGVSYIAMELLRGTDLAQLIKRRGALPVRQVVHFALHAAKSLKEAHTHGIVHRDIKPANLFAANVAGEPDFLKVLDFGVARIRDTEEAARTQAGVVIGTLHYIAPEGIMGQEADVRTDIYSFGATLYHLLTGRPPFAGRNTSALVAAQMYDMPPNPSVRRGETIPADLEDIVMRCLAKAPEARFQRFADVITALTKLDLPEWTPADARDAERVDESPASSETASAG